MVKNSFATHTDNATSIIRDRADSGYVGMAGLQPPPWCYRTEYPLIDCTVTEATHARFFVSAGMKGSPCEQGTATTTPVHAGRTSTVNPLIIHGIKLARKMGMRRCHAAFGQSMTTPHTHQNAPRRPLPVHTHRNGAQNEHQNGICD